MNLCPHCGADLVTDEPIERGSVRMDPYGDCVVDGRKVPLTRVEGAIVWSLLKADGQPLSRHILAERWGYDGDQASNLANVFLSRIRRKFRERGLNCPIETSRKFGVRWST